jgi:ribosomal protein S18 acetylase RimI-like enzyme
MSVAAQIVPYKAIHFDGLKALWREAFPNNAAWNAPEIMVPAKLAFQPELFWVALEGERVVGSVMAGYDGHRGWIYALAVLASHRGKGVASALLRDAEKHLEALGCIKVNLQVRGDNTGVVQLYEHLGYGVEDRISMGKLLGRFAS